MMTDAQFVKTFSKMIIALTILTVVLISLGVVIGGSIDDKLQAQTEEFTQKIVAERTQPVGKLNVGEISVEGTEVAMATSSGNQSASVTAAADSSGSEESAKHPGEVAYQKTCYICHDVGLTGAPKPGDAENWGPRIEKGIDELYNNSINGFQGQRGVMPPKGGNPTLSDEEVMAAVDWLVELLQQ